MDLHEGYAKPILAQYGVPMPRGAIAATDDDVARAVQEFGPDVMLKILVRAGRRGKAGGVRPARGADEAIQIFRDLLRLRHQGMQAGRVLVEEKLAIEKEYYVSLTIDDAERQAMLVVSAAGGMDVEEAAREAGAAFACRAIDPWHGLLDFQVRGALAEAGISVSVHSQFLDVAKAMYRLFRERDATLVEVNPLAQTTDGRLVATDAKISIDNAALFRQGDMMQLALDRPEEFPDEQMKQRHGFDYVEVDPDGNVGLLSTGAGGTMLTIDLISKAGGRAVNFVDLRTGGLKGDPTRLVVVLQVLAQRPRLRSILVNVFGGVTNMADFADCLVRALQAVGQTPPLVVRIEGNNVEAGQAILEQAGLRCHRLLEPAVEEAVRMARARG